MIFVQRFAFIIRNDAIANHYQEYEKKPEFGAFSILGSVVDTHKSKTQLHAHGVALEPIIEAWSRAKFAEKQLRKSNGKI